MPLPLNRGGHRGVALNNRGIFKSKLTLKKYRDALSTKLEFLINTRYREYDDILKAELVEYINKLPCPYCSVPVNFTTCTIKGHTDNKCQIEDVDIAYRLLIRSDEEIAAEAQQVINKKAEDKALQRANRLRGQAVATLLRNDAETKKHNNIIKLTSADEWINKVDNYLTPSFQYSTLAASEATTLFDVDLPIVINTLDSYDCPDDLGVLKLADVKDKAKLLATKFSTLPWAELYLTSLRHSYNNAKSFSNAIHSNSTERLDSVRFGNLKRPRAKTPSDYKSKLRRRVRGSLFKRVDTIFESLKFVSKTVRVINSIPSGRKYKNNNSQQSLVSLIDEEVFTLPTASEILEIDTNISAQEDILKELYRERNRRTREFTVDNPIPVSILCMSGPNAEYEIKPYIYQSVGRKKITDNSISELFQARYNIRPVTNPGNSSVESITNDRTIIPKRHLIFGSNNSSSNNI